MKCRFSSHKTKQLAAIKTLFLLFVFALQTLAQETNQTNNFNNDGIIELKGRVLNEYTKEAIPFVNIVIQNTITGTAADEEGIFSITFPSYYSSFNVKVSAIGFTAKAFSIEELKKVKEIVIELKPINYEIVSIDIEAESKILYGIIRKAITETPKNYISSPYTYQFDYKNSYIAGTEKRITQSKGIITDNTGYNYQTLSDLFTSRSYRFTSTERNFKAPPFNLGMTNFDEILEYDIVRSNTSIFSPEHLYNYQLELIESEPYEQDTLMRIAFKNISPNAFTTRDAYIKYYEGEIFVLKNSHVVLKCIIRGSSDQKSVHGKSFYAKGNKDVFANDIRYVATITYHTNGKEYHLSSINLNEEFITPDKLKGKSVTNIIIPEHEVLSDIPEMPLRDYYNRPNGF